MYKLDQDSVVETKQKMHFGAEQELQMGKVPCVAH